MKIVHHVKRRETLDVEIDDVFLRDGFVILKMTAETTPTKVMKPAMEGTESVQNLNSDAKMTSVFLDVGNVIMMMIVVMDQTRILARTILVQKANSNVILDIALKKN